MGSKATKSLAIFLLLNLVFFAESQLAPAPQPAISPPPPASASCPLNALQLSVCLNVGGIIGVNTGNTRSCCSLLGGLVELNLIACVCELEVNLLGIDLDLDFIINTCNLDIPPNFACPA